VGDHPGTHTPFRFFFFFLCSPRSCLPALALRGLPQLYHAVRLHCQSRSATGPSALHVLAPPSLFYTGYLGVPAYGRAAPSPMRTLTPTAPQQR
jgi:hypothetical protein